MHVLSTTLNCFSYGNRELVVAADSRKEMSLNASLLSNVKSIVVHPGPAHADDLLAVAVALAAHAKTVESCELVVERREPTEQELDDSRVLVLDVGGRHEPERLNFDHHQLPRDAEPACALSMFLNALALDFGVFAWYSTTVLLDSKGPMVTLRELGIDMNTFQALYGPTASFFTRKFSAVESMGSDGGWLYAALVELGTDLIDSSIKCANAIESVRNGHKVVTVNGCRGLIIDRGIVEDDQLAFASGRVRDEIGGAESDDVIGFSVSPDPRGGGWSLYRYDDDTRVDFSRLDGHDNVVFAHKGGFVAKTNDSVSLPDAIELVGVAVVATDPA